MYGITGGIVRVIGSVDVATGAERVKGGTVRGATEVCGATEGSTVPGGVIAGWVTGAVYGATGMVRSTGDTVCGEAAESECGTVGAIHKPKRSRWRSTAAIAAAVTASTICLREGAEAASEPCTVLDRSCTVLDIGAREGRRCVTRGLKVLGGNDGVSLSVSAAWDITGGPTVDATFKMIKQGLHDERLTRSSSGFRAEEAVSGRVLGLLKTSLDCFFGERTN